MMLKLMKYEIKSTYKTFFTIMASFVLLTILLCMSMKMPNTPMLLVLFSGACFMIGGGTFIAYLLTLFNRYYKNLYGREGYLMFTLPVKGWELVCSKFAIALFWSIALCVAIGLCLLGTIQFMILNSSADMIKENYTLFKLLKEAMFEHGYWHLALQMILSTVVGIAKTIARIYFVIAVAYLPFIKRGHIPIALFLYFVIDVVESFIVSNMMRLIFHKYYHDFFSITLIECINVIGIPQDVREVTGFYAIMLVSVIFIALLLAASSYLLDKKTSIK